MTAGQQRAAAAARADFRRGIAVAARAVRRRRNRPPELTFAIADTQTRMAATLRRLAASARARRRYRDAERLDRRAARADRLAASWRARTPAHGS